LTLSRLWHHCSELCHVYFTLSLAAETPEFQVASYEFLNQAEEYLRRASTSLIGWSRPHEPWVADLEKRYVEGDIGDEEVEAKMKETGV
jgi:hypothetical protein